MRDDTLQWRDGQPWSARLSDRYFCAACGLEETRHVFLQGSRLAERWAAWPAGA
jgi:tRNA 5-methylaminomethyl-2-thiouridine biosynthesis bifunctional protein